MKTLSKKHKYIGITLLLLALTLICVACGGKSYKLHIEAPTQTEAELGTYVVPKYDVVNEYGTVMAGYEVTLLSVKDSNGNSVEKTNNRIEITKAGIYELEYTANNKKVPNVTVKVDFADRTPPVITTYLDSYPDLFLAGHTYGIPTYSVDDASATRAMKLYYKSQSGERKEIDYEGLYFTVEENEGEYQFVFTAEDSVGNKSEITHVVPVDGPQTYVENRIAYFNEPFGAREVRLMNNDTNAMTAEYSTEVAYGSEEGSTIISINEQTGWALIELRYPTIENLSNYDSFTWRVYNPNDWALIFGLAWTAYQRLEPKTWTEFTLPTSYFRNHGDDSLQTPNYMPVYEDNISGLTFVVMHEFFSQNGDVAEGTKLYFSALDAYRAEGNDLRIAGDTYNLVYDQTDYDLDDYRIVNRAGVTVYSANVTLDSAIAPDGTQAIVENGKLKFNQEGTYTFVYKGEYTGNDYDKTIDDLTVKIVNGGSLANADKGDAIDGCAVYADRKYGIKQIASTKNVAVQIDEETKYGTESASMKFTVISDGVADVVFNTESVSNPENYEAIQFRVFTKNNNVFRIWVTHGENSEYLGADSVTCFDEGDGWVTVVCYLKDVDRSKLGIHFFNTYATGSVIPAYTEIFVSNIHFVDGGFIGLPQDSTVNLITQENAHTVPATITGRNGVVLPVTVVSVKHNGSDVVVVDKSFTLAETGEYTVTYLLNVKEYHYTITVTAEMEDIELVYDPNQTTYTVSEQLTVTGVKLNGAEVAREGNVITLGEAGEYVVTATALGEEVSFKITYCKPQEVKENVAVYAEGFGVQQVNTTSNLTVMVATDAEKGNVLKLTIGTEGANAAVLFHNKSLVKDYDYVSFWVKTDGVAFVGITQSGTSAFGNHIASTDETWKRVSFHFLSQNQTWWYDDDTVIGLYLSNGFNGEAFGENACVYITDICFEKGSAQIENVTDYNMAKNGAEYTLPTTAVDNHGVDKDCAHTATLNVPVTILGVKKGDETLTVTEGKMTFTGAGVYTVSYKAYNTEYHYTITVTAEIEDIELVYDPNQTTYTVSEQLTVTGVKLNGAEVAREGNVITLGEAGEYVVTATASGEEVSFKITYCKPQEVKENVAVYAEEFGIKQITASNNIAAKVADDAAAKGKVLRLTLSADQTGVGATGVKFKSVSAIKNYDYISFDIKASVNDVYVAYSADGLSNWSSHFAIIGTEWKRVSFALSVTTTWYQDNGYLGLSFFKDFGAGVLPAGAVFEITNICLEKGNAQIKDVENYNIAQSGETYTFPTMVSDSHIRYWDGSNKPVDCGVKIVKVVKDGKEIALNADGLGFNAEPGFYTVHYATIHDGEHLFHTEYYYTISVIDVHIANETLYYKGNENYTLPVKSVGGKAVTVTSITCGDGQTVGYVDGRFSLTSGTPETANDTNKYVYTVNYTLADDETTYSYTVTYYRPTSVEANRVVYLDTEYGVNHQFTAENAIIERSDSCYVQESDGTAVFGEKSMKIIVKESGVVWLNFTNVAWDVAYNNLRIGFSTSAVLRYGVYDANGNKIGEDEVAFAEKGDIGRWFQTFKANLNGKDMSSFSIKLFSAYGDNEALAAGTEIIVAACNGHTF